MNLKDKLCYPSPLKNDTKEGLTFRERLIIALASNPEMMCVNKEFDSLIDKDITAENLIKQADAIIKQLEEK